MEEDREAEAEVEGGSRAGPEDPLPKGLPTAVLAGSCFPCEATPAAVGRAGLLEAAPCPAGFCSEAGPTSLLAQQEELKGRKEIQERGSKS